jgi:hypothetical protein
MGSGGWDYVQGMSKFTRVRRNTRSDVDMNLKDRGFAFINKELCMDLSHCMNMFNVYCFKMTSEWKRFAIEKNYIALIFFQYNLQEF